MPKVEETAAAPTAVAEKAVETEKPWEEDEPKAEKKKAEADNSALQTLKAEMEKLKADNALLAGFKEKWEAAEAARLKAEEDRKREELTALLTAEKLKAEDFEDALAALDYSTVIAAVNRARREATKNTAPSVPTVASNGLVQTAGIQMSGGRPDHPYRKLVKDLTI